ncbi:MAG: sugar transferase, partial [Nitrospinales bacterium]
MSPSPSGSAFAEMESSIPNGFSGIIIGGNAPLSRVLTEKLTQARMRGARIYPIPDFYENFWFKIPVFHLHDRWFVFSHGFDLLHNPVWRKLKRLMDVALAAVFLAALSPVMLIAALAVKLTSPGPILYSQTRTGLNDREFKVYKFRTMRPDAEKNGPQWTATH